MELSNTKRVTLCLDKDLYYDLEEVARIVGKQRDQRCSKSEIAQIALTAFICSFRANIGEKETD